MNIFLREMKANLKSLILWCIGVLFMVGGGMAKYTAISSSGQSMNELLSQMPRALRLIWGADFFDLSKASGFYSVLYLYILIMTTIQAAMLGANIISKEEEDRTSEFLFTKPSSRNKIITFKLLAALTNIIILNIITTVSSLIIVGNYSKGEEIRGDIGILMLGMFILQLIFLFIGTGLAAISKNPKSAAAKSTGIVLFMYLLSIASELNEKLKNLKYLTPYKYFEAKNVMYGGGFEAIYVVISILIIVVMIFITYLFYGKRDLRA